MRDRILTNRAVALAAVVSLSLASLGAQEFPPSSDDSFEVEPPLLVKPWEEDRAPDEAQEVDPMKLAQQLERAKKSAASAERLVRAGVLAKTEAEQRALRVVRLEAELAQAQLLAAQEQVTTLKARFAAGQAAQAEVNAATATLAQATAAARTADEKYRKAQLEAAELNLRRQRKLLALGSAHKSDVARAEEKLAKLQQAEPQSQ